MKCATCDVDPLYLGSTACVQNSSNSWAITPFGLIGEIVLAVLSLGIFFLLIWVYRRSAVSKNYIKTSYAPQEENKHEKDPSTQTEDPLNGLDGSQAFPADMEIKAKEDEWSSGKESSKEVWLDVPKIK